MILFNKYKVLELLVNGCYGSIYKGENIRTCEKVAIKVETKNKNKNKGQEKEEENLSLLKREAQIYLCLENIKGFSQLKWFGADDNNTYLIMNLLGDSLQQFKIKHEKCSSIMVKEVGIQMIQRIQLLHSKGLVHRDIKPANFLFGLNNQGHILHLIDFGFCKKYKLSNDKHILFKTTSNIIGTMNFISLNIHKKIEPTRRDDIESIIYILLFLLGEMSWEKYKTDDIESILKIVECKQNILYCIPDFLKEMLEYVRSLEFEQEPDYKFLIGLLS